MKQLQPGMMIMLTDGRRVKVKQFLGEGAQGWVYLVDVPEKPRDPNCPHKEMVLKWYKQAPSTTFFENLKKNAQEGAPSHHFIWPQAVARFQMGSTGYIMDLRPQGSFELSDFRLAKVRFQSFAAILRACLETCEAFKQLHLRGLSYQDLNDGNFFVNPQTGEVKVIDNDNVFPHGEKSGIWGKMRYMAPEVVMGQKLPDIYSDRFSLAVILFMYLFIDHPFEGENVLQYPCMTEALERKLFGENLCFVYDKSRKNAPVQGVHNNVLLYWPMWPKRLQELFCEEFSNEKLQNPQSRLTESEWMQRLMEVRDQLVVCPHCGDETFVGRESSGFVERLMKSTDRCLNPKCRQPVKPHLFLFRGKRQIPLFGGSLIYTDNINTPAAQVHINMRDTSMLLIRNLQPCTWVVTTLTNRIVDVPTGEYVPAKFGLKIKMANNQVFEVTV